MGSSLGTERWRAHQHRPIRTSMASVWYNAELRWAMSQETCGDCMTSFFPAGKGSERSFQDGVLTWGTARFVDLGIWVPAFLRFRFTIVTITQELPFKFGVLWYLIFSFSKFYVSKPLEPSLGVENIHLHPEWLYQLISYSSVIRGTGFWPTAIYPSSPQYGYVQKQYSDTSSKLQF